MKAAFQIKKASDNQPYFTLANGDQIVGISERYRVKTSCKNGIDSVRKNAGKAEILAIRCCPSG